MKQFLIFHPRADVLVILTRPTARFAVLNALTVSWKDPFPKEQGDSNPDFCPKLRFGRRANGRQSSNNIWGGVVLKFAALSSPVMRMSHQTMLLLHLRAPLADVTGISAIRLPINVYYHSFPADHSC